MYMKKGCCLMLCGEWDLWYSICQSKFCIYDKYKGVVDNEQGKLQIIIEATNHWYVIDWCKNVTNQQQREKKHKS